MTPEQREELIRAVRKNLPLSGYIAERNAAMGRVSEKEFYQNPTPYRGTGKRGAMKGSMK